MECQRFNDFHRPRLVYKVAVQGCQLAGPNCTLAINYSPWMSWPNADDEPDPTLKVTKTPRWPRSWAD